MIFNNEQLLLGRIYYKLDARDRGDNVLRYNHHLELFTLRSELGVLDKVSLNVGIQNIDSFKEELPINGWVQILYFETVGSVVNHFELGHTTPPVDSFQEVKDLKYRRVGAEFSSTIYDMFINPVGKRSS